MLLNSISTDQYVSSVWWALVFHTNVRALGLGLFFLFLFVRLDAIAVFDVI
jgi:hypothetical protein